MQTEINLSETLNDVKDLMSRFDFAAKVAKPKDEGLEMLDNQIMRIICDYEAGFITGEVPSLMNVYRMCAYDSRYLTRALARGRFARYKLFGRYSIETEVRKAVNAYVLNTRPSDFVKEENVN